METSQKPTRKILLLKDTRGFYKTLNISHNSTINWRKRKINVSILKNAELPAYYFVQNKELVRYDQEVLAKNLQKIKGTERDQGNVLNNMEIQQGRTDTQQLDEESIANLRKRESSEHLVNIIAQNNINFEKRTEFSKQKYIDKKMKKYFIIFLVQEISIENVNGNSPLAWAI